MIIIDVKVKIFAATKDEGLTAVLSVKQPVKKCVK
jgi:hypothetical protein